MSTFFRGVEPRVASAYARLARDRCAAADAGLLPTGAPNEAAAAAPAVDDSQMTLVASALDYFQDRLSSQFDVGEAPADPESVMGGGEDIDLDFVAEGRRLLAISSFRVVADASAADAAECCLGEMSRLITTEASNEGALILLPGFTTDVAVFADEFLRQPLPWLGLEQLLSVDAVRTSAGAPMPIVRVFHELAAIPPPEKVSVQRISAREIVEGLSD